MAGTPFINLEINYLSDSELVLDDSIECFDPESKQKLNDIIEQLQSGEKSSSRADRCYEIIQIVESQLKHLDTVGQLLDMIKFTVKLFFIRNDSKCTTDLDRLFHEMFHRLPEAWEEDPVKVHLITKAVHDTLQSDFNNTIQIVTKMICINKIAYYVSLTLWWALYMQFFKKETHYYKMYKFEKFYKLLTAKTDDQSLDIGEFFKLLSLISIYQSHVLLRNPEPEEDHHVFADFFNVTHHDRVKLNDWLINAKTIFEMNNPVVRSNQNTDTLMLLEFLELNLIRNINKDQRANDGMQMKISHATDARVPQQDTAASSDE